MQNCKETSCTERTKYPISSCRAVLAAASPTLLGPSLLQVGSEAEDMVSVLLMMRGTFCKKVLTPSLSIPKPTPTFNLDMSSSPWLLIIICGFSPFAPLLWWANNNNVPIQQWPRTIMQVRLGWDLEIVRQDQTSTLFSAPLGSRSRCGRAHLDPLLEGFLGLTQIQVCFLRAKTQTATSSSCRIWMSSKCPEHQRSSNTQSQLPYKLLNATSMFAINHTSPSSVIATFCGNEKNHQNRAS